MKPGDQFCRFLSNCM